eukprot:GHVS01061528.1.p1 GENE.GHVS01061528.1~~GHVS01061528.1.p1  ORF type:complete len:268 (-),score=35.54 GHVS01061528.1:125-889(-)
MQTLSAEPSSPPSPSGCLTAVNTPSTSSSSIPKPMAEAFDISRGEGLYISVTEAFAKAKDSGGKIRTLELAMAARTIVPVYGTVFGENMVSSNLKKDIENSSSKVVLALEKFKDEGQYIEEFILFEIQQRGVEELRKDSTCGVKNLLWMQRALDFIMSFLELLMMGGPETSSKACAIEAYDKVLKNYHGWLVSRMVTMSFNLCPARQNLLEKLGFPDEADAKSKAAGLMASVRPVLDEVHKLLESQNCIFPDKI